jgi:uncharacterized protein
MLRTRLKDSLAEAMRSKDERAVATLRLILAALKDRDIAARSRGNLAGVADDEILTMLQSMIRQRRESIELYQTAGREELAQQESEEIAVIERFLPEQLSAAESGTAVEEVIAELGATSLKDMGRVMGVLKERFSGQMDFARASSIVKEQLSKR